MESFHNGESPSKHQAAAVVYSPIANNNNLIAPTHSNNAARLTPKKIDMELASHRPVLHKYPAERVEIVYHRKGESEVPARVQTTKSKKSTTPKSSSKSHRGSQNGNESVDQCNQSLDSTFTEQDTNTTSNDSHLDTSRIENADSPSSHSKFTDHPVSVVTVNLTSSASTMTDKAEDDLHNLVKDDQMNQNTEMIDQLWDLIEQMKSEILKLNTRVDDLESIVMTEIQVLKAQRQKHLLSSKAIADDMQRMQNIINNNEWKRIEEDVGQIIKRAKVSYNGYTPQKSKDEMAK